MGRLINSRGGSGKSGSSKSGSSGSKSGSNSDKYVTSKSGMKVERGSAAADRIIKESGSQNGFTSGSSPSKGGSSGSSGSSGGSKSAGAASGGTLTADGQPRQGGMIKANYGGKVGADGIVRYPAGSNVPDEVRQRTQAYLDWNYGTNGGDSDIYRANQGGVYDRTYADLSAGRGINGHYLPADSQAYQDIWGSGEFDANAYNAYLNSGLAAGKPAPGGGGGSGGGYQNTGTLGSYVDRESERELEARVAANNAAIRKAREAYESQYGDIDAQAEDLARQAWVANQQSRYALPQQMAAQGLTGGLTESSLLGLQSSFENNRGGILRQAQQSRDEVARAIAQVEASGDLNEANIRADYYARQAQAREAERQLAMQQAWQERQQQLAYERQRELAAYQNGLDLDAYAKQAMINSQYRTSGGGSGGGLTPQQAYKAYMEDNIDTPEIRALIEPYYGTIWNTSPIQPETTIDPEKAEMLQRWYQSLPNANFLQRVQQELNTGRLTPEEYTAWAR